MAAVLGPVVPADEPLVTARVVKFCTSTSAIERFGDSIDAELTAPER